MNDSPTVDVCVGIHGGCSISYLVTKDKQEAEFSFGTERDGVHYVFDRIALRTFLRLGAEVLEEMESP
jgi:hypothetical protein